MTVFIFLGPSLSVTEARAALPDTDAPVLYLPPVAQGDVYRVARHRPRAIGIIDGYFERVPAVWHKEILWAMAQGIHVYGASSMGALRAAELAAFGMIGVGEIFSAFHRGALEDDDEVAVIHAPKELGYRPLSEAMVNIRATLARAAEAAVIAAATRDALTAAAKALFYRDRGYARVLQRGAELGLDAGELAALRAWLPGGAIHQKRDDALAMLRRMSHDLAGPPAPLRVRYRLEHTEWWDHAQRRAGALALDGDEVRALEHEALAEELRLDPTTHARVRDGATMRCLALAEAERLALTVDAASLDEALLALRRDHGLHEPAALDAWLADNGLDAAALRPLLAEQVRIGRVRAELERAASERVPDELRALGLYGGLQRRALAKRRVLAEHDLHDAGPEDLDCAPEEVLAWYFEQLGMRAPEDLEYYARALGLGDGAALLRAVVREYLYQQHLAREPRR